MSTGYRSEQGLSLAQNIERGCKSDTIILTCIMLINRRVIVVAIFKVAALVILGTVVTISHCQVKTEISRIRKRIRQFLFDRPPYRARSRAVNGFLKRQEEVEDSRSSR